MRLMRDMVLKRSERKSTTFSQLQTVQLLHRSYHALVRCVEEELAPHGLTLPQILALRTIQEGAGQIMVKELADQLGVGSQSLTGLLDRLELQGLARRIHDLKDRRALRLELTDAGAIKLRQAAPVAASCLEEALRDLAADEVQAFTAVLDALHRHAA